MTVMYALTVTIGKYDTDTLMLAVSCDLVRLRAAAMDYLLHSTDYLISQEREGCTIGAWANHAGYYILNCDGNYNAIQFMIAKVPNL